MASSSALLRASGHPMAVPFTDGDRALSWKRSLGTSADTEAMEVMEAMEAMVVADGLGMLGCAQVAHITKMQQPIQVHLFHLHLPEMSTKYPMKINRFEILIIYDHLNAD